jgi:4-methyl-5(b-hydroxyethyl)-thiazole monophosphate biosynthesis
VVIRMKKMILFLADGFEEIEAVSVIDILRRASIECAICAIGGSLAVRGAHGVTLQADMLLEPGLEDRYDGLVLPGGMGGAQALARSGPVLDVIRSMMRSGKVVAAICAAPMVLREAGVLDGRKLTSYPGVLGPDHSYEYREEPVVVDGNLVTSRGPATAPEFALTLVSVLGQPGEAARLKSGMLYR